MSLAYSLSRTTSSAMKPQFHNITVSASDINTSTNVQGASLAHKLCNLNTMGMTESLGTQL